METKTKDFVSIMKDALIQASIESLKQEGLKFSVDTLAGKLKISKKTIYKYFPTKEALAAAIYEKSYWLAVQQMQESLKQDTESAHKKLLKIYFDFKEMSRSEIFNKYKLNQTIYAYASEKTNALWEMLASSFSEKKESEKEILRIIVDGTLEKLFSLPILPNPVLERLVNLLW